MKTVKIVMLMAALTIQWGCSSDNEENGSEERNSMFLTSAKPTWAIDWSSDAAAPDWQEPDATKFECSMNLLVELGDDVVSYSTDGDVMGVFIGGECRGVSYRNKLSDGKVIFLLHVKGSSEESEHPMELRYYCDKLHHLTITDGVPPFMPNNMIDDMTYQLEEHLGDGSTKYPFFTELEILLPEQLPFTENDDDMLAVFVGDECRGVGAKDPEFIPGWRVVVYSVKENETAHVRYYSAETGGVYTIQQTFTLNNFLQSEKITF